MSWVHDVARSIILRLGHNMPPQLYIQDYLTVVDDVVCHCVELMFNPSKPLTWSGYDTTVAGILVEPDGGLLLRDGVIGWFEVSNADDPDSIDLLLGQLGEIVRNSQAGLEPWWGLDGI